MLRACFSSYRNVLGGRCLAAGRTPAAGLHRELPRALRSVIRMASGGRDSGTSSGNKTPRRHCNRLIKEKSLYLKQHAHNPVDWFPWGQEAFEKAAKEMKPIFLSAIEASNLLGGISARVWRVSVGMFAKSSRRVFVKSTLMLVGYSTCHWCHVMERESFENEEIGRILNENFVSVKVDREERPDVDKVYMTFLQATGSGEGWPMNVWLTPDLQPFFGGTYFPPEDGVLRISFRTVLLRIAEQWKQNRTLLCEKGESILNALKDNSDIQQRKEPPRCLEMQTRCFMQLEHMYDDEYGGFAEFPKFPTPVNFSFLFCFWALMKAAPEAPKALHMAFHTLRMMAYGGIHDHIGKGFHRYSTDKQWHVPHFEKMLYDQAQLAATYAEAFQISADVMFADVAHDILKYVVEHLSDKGGGFYSAEDADSLPEKRSQVKKEGAFATWSAQEIRQLLPDIEDASKKTWADIFMQHYGVREEGNVSANQDVHGELMGKNVLIVRYSLELTAATFGLDRENVQSILSACRKRLYQARKQRPLPQLDTKIVAAWNGLMISGFARCGVILGDIDYIKRAECAANFLHEHMYDKNSGMLWRSCYWMGQASRPPLVPGFLDDYVFVIRGLLDLYEASLDPAHLQWAEQLQLKQDELFWDSGDSGYFSTSNTDPSIVLRLKDDQDGAEPSGNSVSVVNLLRLSCYTGREEWTHNSGKIVAAFSDRLLKVPSALPEMVRGAMIHQQTIKQVILCGERGTEDTVELLRATQGVHVPNKVLILADGVQSGYLYRQLPFLATLERKDGKATAYVCEKMSCSLPVTSPAELHSLLMT